MKDGRLVYSTESGDRRRQRPDDRPQQPSETWPNDGIIRVSREKGGRGGKTVTIVRGLPAGEVAVIASDLKRRLGSGGAVRSGAVEIQGDHRQKAASLLEASGYRVKLAGG